MPAITGSKGVARQSLGWLPNSYYHLRDPQLVARIVAVEADRLKGEIFSIAKLCWVNEQPNVAGSALELDEWDLKGDSSSSATHDLMKLIR